LPIDGTAFAKLMDVGAETRELALRDRGGIDAAPGGRVASRGGLVGGWRCALAEARPPAARRLRDLEIDPM